MQTHPLTKITIVEDEPIIAADLKIQLEKSGLEVVDIFDDGTEALSGMKINLPDIVIMDINIFGDLDGIDVANQINKTFDIPIIFLTSNTDAATFKRAKFTYPHAFLSKPFRIKDILHAIELSVSDIDKKTTDELEFLSDRIFIRNKNSLEKVFFNNIHFIEAQGAYSKIVTADKEYVLSQTLRKTEEKIKSPQLMRVHRSFIVNVQNIDRISEGFLYSGENQIPVSRTHREELLKRFRTL